MIYFDNAATSKYKPEEVYEAFMHYVRDIGTSPGRGSYKLGVEASRMLYKTRKCVCEFFGLKNSTNVVFTKNSTEAINLFFNGYLKKGDHVLISSYEHNAVFRPLHLLKLKGIIDYTILPEKVFDDSTLISSYIKPNTKLAAITLASNLTGQLVYNRDFGKCCLNHNIKVFVDASQGGGKGIINMERDFVDYLAFTGHKDLYALPGVGGLCSKDKLDFPPLLQGGTGIYGDEYINPKVYPEAYESGTLNMPAIWSLKTAIDYLNNEQDSIISKENCLLEYLIERLSKLENITLYNAEKKRVSTICFNVNNMSSSEVVSILDRNDICVRGGIHCAILAHQTLGTVSSGAVRISLNHFNDFNEIDKLINVLGGLK